MNPEEAYRIKLCLVDGRFGNCYRLVHVEWARLRYGEDCTKVVLDEKPLQYIMMYLQLIGKVELLEDLADWLEEMEDMK